ncbi:hypothetical protein HAX54_021016 [Datura stramonium]|uniref:Uncharacterized protein n=1 Tax=Datura stramonium TaxID=4076 RepID=A0ABS8UTI1_DATST|nr:hypothetical protein [Datura stramonium]
MFLNYIPLVQKEGKPVVKLEETDYKSVEEHWSTELIFYVLGDNRYEATMANYVGSIRLYMNAFLNFAPIVWDLDTTEECWNDEGNEPTKEEEFKEVPRRKRRTRKKQAWRIKAQETLQQDAMDKQSREEKINDDAEAEPGQVLAGSILQGLCLHTSNSFALLTVSNEVDLKCMDPGPMIIFTWNI